MTGSTWADFVPGDITGLSIPAHDRALACGGEAFLTRAFRAFGTIAPDNRVTRITARQPCPGGSTGQKLYLSVEYENLREPGLVSDLFVKFSRDFSDPQRDRGKYEMEAEVRFAALSRLPAFPIRVPAAFFADYQRETGTGILITERIEFGRNGIEPHHPKCRDHELDDPLPYYRAIITDLARLAAAHRAGLLSPAVENHFPFDPQAAIASDRIPYDKHQLRDQVARFAEFARQHPQLLPASIADPDFFAELAADVGLFLEHEPAIKAFLQSDSDYIALCHWNANIDNAWFWRDSNRELQCGLMDWGRVRQLNLAYALWGSLSGAALEVWNQHLEQLLDLFVSEFHRHGGPLLDPEELEFHLQLYAATMGLAWLLEAPARILQRLPEAAGASGPTDPVFLKDESARNQLHIATNLLNFWQTRGFRANLHRNLHRLKACTANSGE